METLYMHSGYLPWVNRSRPGCIQFVVNGTVKFLGSVFGCRDVERLLFEYVQGALDPEVKRRLDDHFHDCPPCIDFLRTYRQTIDVTRRFCCNQVEIPPEVRTKLKEFIRAEL